MLSKHVAFGFFCGYGYTPLSEVLAATLWAGARKGKRAGARKGKRAGERGLTVKQQRELQVASGF